MEKQKSRRVALIQAVPVHVQFGGEFSAIELLLLDGNGTSRRIYFVPHTLSLRVLVIPPARGEQDNDGQLFTRISAYLKQALDYGDSYNNKARLGNPLRLLPMGPQIERVREFVTEGKTGRLFTFVVPVASKLHRLDQAALYTASNGRARFVDMPEAGGAVPFSNARQALVHYLRQNLFFDLYDEMEIPAFVDRHAFGDDEKRLEEKSTVLLPNGFFQLMDSNEGSSITRLSALCQSAAEWYATEDWRQIPDAFVPSFYIEGNPKIAGEVYDICLALEEPHSRYHIKKSGARQWSTDSLRVLYPDLLDRLYNKTWIYREMGEPSLDEILPAFKIALAIARYARCPFEAVLLSPRLFLATRIISHLCTRCEALPPLAVHHFVSLVASQSGLSMGKRARQEGSEEEAKEEEGGETPEEVEYKGGQIFEVEPGAYVGHLELLDFDTYYMSLMAENSTILFDSAAIDKGAYQELFAQYYKGLIEVKRSLPNGTPKSAIKLVINVIYGCKGRRAALMSNQDTAARTTSLGRLTLMNTNGIVEAHECTRRFGHTDSIMVDTRDRSPEESHRLLDAIVEDVNKDYQTIKLKRSERFCLVWVQNRTRFIGIREPADGRTLENWLVHIQHRLVEATTATVDYMREEGARDPDRWTPSRAVQALADDLLSDMFKFPGLLASNMPPAFKVATMTCTFSLLVFLYWRRKAEAALKDSTTAEMSDLLNALNISNTITEQASAIGELVSPLFEDAGSLRLLAWLYFSTDSKTSTTHAYLRVRGSAMAQKVEDFRQGAGDCDTAYWKRRLNERLHQQINEQMTVEADAVKKDLHVCIDLMLPLEHFQDRLAKNKLGAMKVMNPLVIWNHILRLAREKHEGNDLASSLPDVPHLAEALLGREALPILPAREASLAAIRVYAELVRDFALQCPHWALIALDAFSIHVMGRYNLAEYMATSYHDLSAERIRAALASRQDVDLQPLVLEAARQMQEVLLPTLASLPVEQ